MTSYTRVVERGLRLVVAMALMLGVIPIDVAAAQPMAETAGASSIRSVDAAPVVIDRVEALRETRAYPAALDQSLRAASQNSAPQNSAPQAPDAVSLTATKRDALVTDINSNGKADPGDTLEYTVVITDNGTTDATGLNFIDTLDANTTLSGTLSASPVAVNDTYPQTVIGNVSINSALIPFSLTSNDFMGLNPAATITAYDATSANGGTVVVNADGTFTYDPPRGFTGTDTFNYTLSNSVGSNTATVTLIISGLVWFINNNSACSANCDGRLSHPYLTLAAFNTANGLGGGLDPHNNDNIFIYESSTTYSGGVILRSGQKLIGQDSTSALAAITGLTPLSGSAPFPAMNAGAPATVIVNAAGNGVTLNSGNTLNGFTASNASGSAISGSGFGTLSVADVIVNTTGQALNLTNGTLNATFSSVTSSGGTNNIVLAKGAGVLAGTLTINAGALSGATGNAFDVNGGTATISYAGTIGNTTARSVNIANMTGGTTTLSGAVSGSGTGINLATNTGATINFQGGLVLSTGVNPAFTATGGGTVNVCDENPCNPAATGALVNTLTTTTGTALNVVNTTIGANKLEFRSISSNGATNGIVLNNTGSSGSLTVKGDGTTNTCRTGNTTCSGGTIQNSTGDGISLTSTQVNLSLMWIKTNANSGIKGTTVSGFTASDILVQNNTNAAGEQAGILLNDLTDSNAQVTRAEVSGSKEDNVRVHNSTATGTVTFTSCTVIDNDSNPVGAGNQGIFFQTTTTGNLIGTVTNSTLHGNRTIALRADSGDGSTLNATFTNNTITAGSPNQGNQGIEVSRAGTSTLTFNVTGNTVSGMISTLINVFSGGGPGTATGDVKSNIVTGTGVGGNQYGIRLFNSGSAANGFGTMNVNVANNTVSNIDNAYPIIGEASGSTGSGGLLKIAVTGNTANVASGGTALDSIRLQARNTSSVCATVSGNTTNSGGSGFFGIQLRRANTSVFQLEGLTSGTQTDPAAHDYVVAQNPAGGTVGTLAAVGNPDITGVAAGSCGVVAMLPNSTYVAAQNQIETNSKVRVQTANTGLKSENTFAVASGSANLFKQSGWASAPSVAAGSPSVLYTRVSGLASDLFTALRAPALSGETINVSVGTLPAGKSVTIKFRALINNPVPDGVIQVSNQGTVTADGGISVLTDDPDTIAPNDPTVTPLNIVADIQLLSKSDGGITATPGQQFGYTLVYTNAGPQGAADVVLTETVPANTTYTGSGWTCGSINAGGTCTNNIGIVSRNIGGSVVFTVTVINPVPAGVTQLSNTASIGTSVIDPVPGNNTASDTTPIDAAPDLALTKSDGNISTTPGSTLIYTLTYSNMGNQGATGVVLTETVPANTTFNSVASSAGWSCANGAPAGTTCTLSVGSLAGGGASGSRTFAVTAVNPIAAGVTQTSNTASVADDGSNGVDTNPANNTASDTTPVNAAPDLTLTKTDGGISTTPGSTVVYTLTYSNVGNQGATGVVLTDTVPANTIFNVGSSSGGWSCTPDNNAGSVCTLTIGALDGGGASGSRTFAVTIVNPVPAGVTQISNTIIIADDGSNGTDPTPANNTASDTTPVTAAPDLQLSKSDGGARGVPNGAVVYTLAFTNTGNQGATGAILTDTVPANTTFNAGASSAGWSCANGAPSGTICSLVVGGVIGGGIGSRLFAVTVDSPFPSTESSITNTASIADDGANGVDATPANNIASDSTPIDTVPDVAITKTHTGNFTKGQVGATYTLHASNVGGLPTTDVVTVTDVLPAGLTATGLSGIGWACDLGTLTCTRSDVLSPFASYPDITLTVDVAVNTSSTVTNTATVSGGGESNTANDTANDVTSINRAASATALISGPNPSVFGQSVTFTATVTSGVGTPTGIVTFTEGAVTLGTGTLSGGVATFSTSSLAVGTHTITATYGGDTNLSTSTVTTTQTVNNADSATTLTSAPNPSVFGQSVTFTATVSASAPGAGTPTGVVTFTEGAATLGTGTLSGGVATFTTSVLSVGSHDVIATYSGDGSFNASNTTTTQIVNAANSATTVTSAVNPSVFGQSVTFTATVIATAPGAGTPTGSVTFFDNGASIGTGALSSGVATFSTVSLSVGTHPITATYTGNVNFNASVSNQIDQVVAQANTSTALASHPNPSVFGQAVVFTATVTANTPGSGTPTGNVTFFDNGASIGSGVLSGGVATFSTTSLVVGTHPITATYNGDTSFTVSTSSSLSQVVNRANTSTALVSNPNPSVFGESVTFTATVTADAPGSGTPTGSVTFFDNGTSIGTGTLSGGVATFSTSSLAVGSHPIVATYTGDTSYNSSSTTTLNQVVDRADTTTAIASDPNPSLPGQTAFFTATVSAVAPGAGTPTGNVTFYDNGASIGTRALSGGIATLNTAALVVGQHPITATYAGNVSFNVSTATIYTQTVSTADTGTTLASNPNPTVFGQAVTFTATVTATFGTPIGSVTFFDNGASIGAAALSSGVATLSTASLSVGTHPITATYTGNVNFNASVSNQIDQVVDQASTSTALASHPNPSVFGQTVTFTATVTAVAPGAGTPTGSVTFFDNGASIGTGALSSGVATFNTASLAVGTHPITATYTGDASFIVSTSNQVDQVVNQANTATVLASHPNPSVFGQAVTFTATVMASAPGSGTPTGSVTFFDNGTSIGSGGLSGGVATLNRASLAVGTHSITATYSGDASFDGSTAVVLSQVVDQAGTNTALVSAPNPSIYGQSVTFTATVSASAPGAGTPAGTVTVFNNGVSLGSSALSGGVATLATTSLLAGTHTITATYSGDASFVGSTSAGLSQVVDQASSATALTSAPNPSFFGQAVTLTATVTSSGGTPTGSVVFHDGATSLGTVSLSGGVATLTTTAFTAGSHSLTAQSSGDANFIGSTSPTVTQVVDKATATVALGGLNQMYDGTPRPITATTNPIGLVVTFTYDGGSTPPVNAGSYAVVGIISDANYAGSNSGTLLVAHAPLTVTANNAGKIYGDANPPFSVVYAGFQGSDDANSLTTQPTATSTATVTTPVGTYAITPGGGASINYAFTYLIGTLTISTAPLTVTADNQSRAYGAANPTLTVSYAGFKAGDNATNLSAQPIATTTATVLSSIGNYSITVSSGASNNYTFTYVPGTLTVARAALTVTADDQTRFFGATNPTLTVSYSGFVNDETQTVLGGSPVLTTTADVNSLVGAYPITITAGTLTATNYAFTFVNGTLHVIDTPITNVSAVNDSPTIIGASTMFTATGTGTNLHFNWQFGDGSIASGNPVTHTYAAIGNYPVTVTVSNSAASVSASTLAAINRSSLYLPLVMNQYVAAPDLIVQRITAAANTVQIVIKNQGDRPVTSEFWVDVYINPTAAPTHVNQTWPSLGTQGLVWGVNSAAFPALVPGGVLTLTVNDAYFWPSLSNVSWPLSVGTPVYAQVDSADTATTYGAVLENHEIVGGAYNNILGPVLSTATIVSQTTGQPLVAQWPATPFYRWPLRPQSTDRSR